LRTELRREAEAVFSFSGDFVLIESSDDFDLTLRRQSAILKVKIRSRADRRALGDDWRRL